MKRKKNEHVELLKWKTDDNLTLDKLKKTGNRSVAIQSLLFACPSIFFTFFAVQGIIHNNLDSGTRLIIIIIACFSALIGLMAGVNFFAALIGVFRPYKLSASINRDNLSEVEEELRRGFVLLKAEYQPVKYLTKNYIIDGSSSRIIRIKDIVEINPKISKNNRNGIGIPDWTFSYSILAKGIDGMPIMLFTNSVYKKRECLAIDKRDYMAVSNYLLNELSNSGCKTIAKGFSEAISSDFRWVDILMAFGLHPQM